MSGAPRANDFTRITATFEDARRRAGTRHEAVYSMAGALVRMNIAGSELAQGVDQALAHLRCDDSAEPPGLTIDLWDAQATGVAAVVLDDDRPDSQTWRIGQGTVTASPDSRFIRHMLDRTVVCLDRKAQRIVGWYASAADVSLHQRGKPLQMLLAVWASDRGLVAVHAACIARKGAGVLLPGRSGAGKSTAALACLHAGFDSLGDDWIGIGAVAHGAAPAYGLYSSTYLQPVHATRFPRITSRIVAPNDPDTEKALLFLTDAFPRQMRGDTTLRALALPRIIAGTAAHVRPAAKRDALLTLIPSTVFEMYPRVGRAGIDRLTQLVEELPAYWLEMGSDLDAIPRCVGEILASVGVPR